MNSNEFYQMFRSNNPDVKVHYSTFVKLRPLWCKWPGRYGHHNTCTCVIHENYLARLRAANYKGRISKFVEKYLCTEPERDCFMGQCSSCRNIDEILNLPIPSEEVEYDLWRHTDRATLVTVRQDKDSFLEELQEDFLPFVTHHYIMKQQASYIDSLKQKIQTEKSIFIKVDFAENYSLTAQNAISSFHWNNNQSTLHPFVVSYFHDNIIKTKTFVVVSDALEHSASTFHWFRSLELEELKKEGSY